MKNENAMTEQIIVNGRVEANALASLEKKGVDAATATGYLIAARHELEKGNLGQAHSYFEAAIRFGPDNPTILNYYAALLLRMGNPSEALHYAEHAVRVAPNSPDTLAMLGYTQFATDHTPEAIRSWKRSLELRPDKNLEQQLLKAQREASAESDFSQHESSHFTLHYEGKQTSEAFRHQLVSVLESEYDDLVRALGVAPRASISVFLYTEQAFFDVTQSPSWAGAVNDGKLRIPVEGMTSVTPELARVLKHELTHSFVNQLSGGRCPQWLNEGIAQAMEPKSLASHGRMLAQLFQADREIPLNALEGSFMNFSGMQAVVAYDESLAAVQYIDDTYGVSDLQRILQRLAEGSSTEAALRTTIHSDYGELQTEVGKYLANRYGS
jgi:Flp pilus assembly protein TadD